MEVIMIANRGTPAWKIFLFSFLGCFLAVSIIFAVFYLLIFPIYNQMIWAAMLGGMFGGIVKESSSKTTVSKKILPGGEDNRKKR